MIKTINITLFNLLLLGGVHAYAQSFNAGFIFQYHFLKQIDVNSETIAGTFSHNIFNVKENNWKAFGAGQSVVVGMMAATRL